MRNNNWINWEKHIAVTNKLMSIILKDLLIIAFLIFLGFFLIPITLFIVFTYITQKARSYFWLYASIFFFFNVAIAIFLGISILFWIKGPIYDISFSYVLYNIMRVEWTYLSVIWLLFFVWGVVRLIRIREIWKELILWLDLDNIN